MLVPLAGLSATFETVSDERAREAALLRLCNSRDGRTLVFANSAKRAEEAHHDDPISKRPPQLLAWPPLLGCSWRIPTAVD